MRLFVAVIMCFLLTAPVVWAQSGQGGQGATKGGEMGHDGGEGLYGETTDKVVTNFGFALIAFFPLLIFTLSMIQIRLDKRKDARKKAEKARKARADLRGGW
jgi:preprotein translocase subunit SecG